MTNQEPSRRPRVIADSEQLAKVTRHRSAGPGAALFALGLIAVGVAVAVFAKLTPVAASNTAAQVDLLFNTMLGIAAAIFLLVESSLIYFAFRYRRKAGEMGDGRPIHGSNRLEIAWTIMPALIVLWLGTYSYQILTNIRQAAPGGGMTVEVTGRQFQWEFFYPAYNVRTVNDLRLPRGEAVSLKIVATDVLHSLWVPALRIKQDAVPGRQNAMNFIAEANGVFPIRCAELCGAGHSRMIGSVTIQEAADFQVWVAEQQAKPAADAPTLITQYGCPACHTLTAVGAAGLVGPNLDGLGARAGEAVEGLSAEDYIRQSITDPNAHVAEGFQPGVMPQDFGTRMTPEELTTLVNFLLEQK
ncbi:MAG: cytochrome c oxidase subunit II [Chloroflexota bacterium]